MRLSLTPPVPAQPVPPSAIEALAVIESATRLVPVTKAQARTLAQAVEIVRTALTSG